MIIENEEINLKDDSICYFLLETENMYGFKIQTKNNTGKIIDVEEVRIFTEDRENALEIFKGLITFTVYPEHLINILDDIQE